MSERDEQRDPGVLGGLSRTRPQRRSGRRATAPATAVSTAAAPSPAKPRSKQGKASSKPPARAKPAAGSAPKTKVKPPARAKPKAVAPLAAADTAPKSKRATIRQPSQPRNVPKQPAPRAPLEPEETQGPSPVVTAAQAAGELAQIGLTVGTQAIKGVLSRLPRP